MFFCNLIEPQFSSLVVAQFYDRFLHSHSKNFFLFFLLLLFNKLVGRRTVWMKRSYLELHLICDFISFLSSIFSPSSSMNSHKKRLCAPCPIHWLRWRFFLCAIIISWIIISFWYNFFLSLALGILNRHHWKVANFVLCFNFRKHFQCM